MIDDEIAFLEDVHKQKSRMFELTDFAKYTLIGLFLFATNLVIGWCSDAFLHMSGVQLTIVLTIYNFVARYWLMKKYNFNKVRE